MRNERKIVRCDRVIAFFIYGLIFTLPFSKALTEIFTCLAIAVFLYKKGLQLLDALASCPQPAGISARAQACYAAVKFKSTYINHAIGLFIAANIFSVIFSQHPHLSINGFAKKWIEQILLFFVMVETLTSRKRIEIFLKVYLLSVSIVCLNGLVQNILGHDLIRNYVLLRGRITSSFKHPNDFAAYLLVACFFILTFLFLKGFRFFEPRIRRLRLMVSCSFLLVLVLACLGLTFSRAAWLVFFLGLLIVGIENKKVIPALVILGLLFYSIFSPLLLHRRGVSLFSDGVLITDYDVVNENSLLNNQMLNAGGRTSFWLEAISIIKKYPFFGAGVNTYAEVVKKYKISLGWYPHNCYLHMAAEIGLVGLAAFLWLCIQLFYRAARFLKKVKNKLQEVVLISCLIGLLVFLAHSFFDTNFYSIQLGALLWIWMALIVSIQGLNMEATRDSYS